MEYPPTFLGFLKAVFDTLRGKKLRPRIPKDKSAKDIDDYEGYDSSKDPGKEFWHTEAQKLAERKEQDKIEAEKRMIEDYEFRHKDDREDENATDESEVIVENKSFVTREEGTTELVEEDASEDHDSVSDADDFSSNDFDTDIEGNFDSGFDSGFGSDQDSGSYDGYIG